ncbi:MAG: hypothetical protein AB8D78_03900 [Akkermansiaceae bacterium]
MNNRNFSPLPKDNGMETIPQGKAFLNFSSALPVSEPEEPSAWFPPLVVFPSVPISSSKPDRRFLTALSSPLSELPAVSDSSEVTAAIKVLPEIVLPPEGPSEMVEPSEGFSDETTNSDSKVSFENERADFTDADLIDAMAPILGGMKLESSGHGLSEEIDAFLEPLLRATIRRALAEYSPASKPFQAPSFMDRTVWRLQALFSSRTFEDVLFEKTNRFHVEEVYLLDASSLALVSFASCDPARHSAVKRIQGSAKRIAMKLRDEKGEVRKSFEQADGSHVISQTGGYLVLAAIVRGQPNEMVLADLAFSLSRIEHQFKERFEQRGSALMHALQPYLEDCLLIQSPAHAA